MQKVTVTAKGYMLQTYSYDCLASTQKHLQQLVQADLIQENTAVVANVQTAAIGSRDNAWESQRGNLFCSIALQKSSLPHDLPLQTASIYFGYKIKQALRPLQDEIYLKWPNDLYIDKDKVGGIITQIVKNFIIIGFGINLVTTKRYRGLECRQSKEEVLACIIKRFEILERWKEVFSKYKLEFDNSKEFFVNVDAKKFSLQDAELLSDGSLYVAGKRIYSLR
ncbi:MAG: biotin--[acetyl-CoA-carboxylase] ligase [Campylobacterota bacterium]